MNVTDIRLKNEFAQVYFLFVYIYLFFKKRSKVQPKKYSAMRFKDRENAALLSKMID